MSEGTSPVGMTELLVQSGAVGRAAEAMIEGLGATTPQGWPDYRSRLAAATAILDRVEGKPIERQQIVRLTKSETPPMEEIIRSPAASAALAKAFMASPAGRRAIEEQQKVLDV